MSRTLVTKSVAPGSYPTAGVAVVWTNADTGDGNEIVMTGDDLLLVRNGVTPASNVAITAVSNASPAVMTSVGHGLVTGNYVRQSGFTGNWTPANATFVVTRIDNDTYSIVLDSSGFGAIAGSPVFLNLKYKTFTLTSQADAQGRLKNITAENVEAGTVHMLGAFSEKAGWAASGGKLQFNGEDSNVKFAVVKVATYN